MHDFSGGHLEFMVKHRTVPVKPGQALNARILRCVRRQLGFDSMGLVVSSRIYNA